MYSKRALLLNQIAIGLGKILWIVVFIIIIVHRVEFMTSEVVSGVSNDINNQQNENYSEY